MDSILQKSLDKSRGLLYGLLLNCIFSGDENHCCPIAQLRDNLTQQEKYKFVMELSKEGVNNVLEMHDKCYKTNCGPQCEVGSSTR
jgi:hypothetical protein